MHDRGQDLGGSIDMVDHNQVIETLVQAIESIPEKRDNRHSDKDPVLEPHYKLVSVIHKLVRSGKLMVRCDPNISSFAAYHCED